VRYWYALERAAKQTVISKVPNSVGASTFRMEGNFLILRLPSGRDIAYPKAHMDGTSLMAVASKPGKPPFLRQLYGGMIAENVTQAFCRDIMAEAMKRLERCGFPVVLTIHDEVVCEVPEDMSCKIFRDLLKVVPDWCTGMPLDASQWEGHFYRKD